MFQCVNNPIRGSYWMVGYEQSRKFMKEYDGQNFFKKKKV